MKTKTTQSKKCRIFMFLLIGLTLSYSVNAQSDGNAFQKYHEVKGTVVDGNKGNAVSSAYVSVDGTNISTVTNSDGNFVLKVPEKDASRMLTISHLGFLSKSMPLDFFKNENSTVSLTEATQELGEVSLVTANSARELVREMLDKKGDNYHNENSEMRAFYREAIKKGNRNVSLSEAVVTIHKQPYTSWASDNISIVKARKNVDYERLDTLALKLRGGPFNTLNIDLMKNSDYIFNELELDYFKFDFDKPTQINDRYVHVVNFEGLLKNEPWYYGKLYIDANTSTLLKASYNLNVDDKKAAANLFVKKKPDGTKVYPTDVHYQIEYREKDGKWYFGYGNTQVEFVVNWKRKLFNSRYSVKGEMVVTDWKKPLQLADKSTFLNPGVIMANDVSGFADTAFWGNDNIIEPDKSIETAIEKIQKQLQ